ncbi:adenylate/guanylate cyclase domain-containing protein [Nocardia asteroides]|uniref:adenylate/guanylate cyclase domain-containing protein n=1 Tax=Nocardia asteroides TaxID=1824 RepID=UPI001E4ABEE9|nr:adenylate/guanylate cyclase domain-containing protein [Nocardia asteroides]UGT61273.1 adenylate/guanylate cyclase domain-containing protein [Nocardia asteroides]
MADAEFDAVRAVADAVARGAGREAAGPVAFGEPRRYTADRAAEVAGIPPARARRFLRALGYPAVDDSTPDFAPSDVRLLRLLTGYVDEGMVDEAEALQLTGVLARAIAQLARLQVDIVAGQMQRAPQTVDTVSALAERMPEVQWLLGQLWRRRLEDALHVLDPAADPPAGRDSGVGFADVVGFTELSRDRRAGDLVRVVARFEHRSIDVVAAAGGSVVKLLGDEILFTADTPAALAEIGTGLIRAFAADPDIPGLRVGAAWGPVIHQLGDVFGTTVNLASRLTALARPDTVLVDPALAEALAGASEFCLIPGDPTDVRGIGVLTPVSLERSAPGP